MTMNKTPNLDLPQYTYDDVFDLSDINGAYKKIDETYKEISDNYKKAIGNSTISGAIDNLELIDARGGFDNLGERLEDIEKKQTIKTPFDYGAIGDGKADDSQALLDAMNDCSKNNYLLLIDKKIRVASNIVYSPYWSLNVRGTKGNYNGVSTTENTSFNSENCNIFFDGGSLEINKMGSVNFYGVGFSGKNRNSDNGIIIKSFHNRFTNCSFSQFNVAISVEEGTNWTGENHVDNCYFVKCNTCYAASEGSDSAIRNNVFHGSCEIGLLGECFSGYNITDNHFYTKQGSHIKGLNILLTGNYIQELSLYEDKPSFTIEPLFGVSITNNKFELLPPTFVRSVNRGLLGIKTKNGSGGITISNNIVTGKDNNVQPYLAFVDFIPAEDGALYDMPIFMTGNNIRPCTALTKNPYKLYNITGTLSVSSPNLQPLGGTFDVVNAEIINNICYFYIEQTTPTTHGNCFKLYNKGLVPTVVNGILTKSDNTVIEKTFYLTPSNSTINISNYAEIKKAIFYGSYPVSHATERQLFL